MAPSNDRSRWSSGHLRSGPVKDRLRRRGRTQSSNSDDRTQPIADSELRVASVQRLEPVAPGSWVLRAWHEAVIGSPSSTVASVTGIVKACVTPAQPHKRSSTLTAVGQVLHKPRGRKPRRPPR